MVKGKPGHIQAMKAYRGSKGVAPLILTRDTGWKRVSTSKSWPHHAREGRAQYEVKWAPVYFNAFIWEILSSDFLLPYISYIIAMKVNHVRGEEAVFLFVTIICLIYLRGQCAVLQLLSRHGTMTMVVTQRSAAFVWQSNSSRGTVLSSHCQNWDICWKKAFRCTGHKDNW